MDVNVSAVFGLAIRLITLVIIFELLVRQYIETRQPRDSFTRLRWYLFSLLMVVIIMFLPGTGRLYELISEHAGSRLATISVVTTNIGLLAFSVILRLMWTYRRKE